MPVPKYLSLFGLLQGCLKSYLTLLGSEHFERTWADVFVSTRTEHPLLGSLGEYLCTESVKDLWMVKGPLDCALETMVTQ